MTYRALGAMSHYLSLTLDQGEDRIMQVSAIGKIWTFCRVRIWDWSKKLWFVATNNTNCPEDENGNIYILFPSKVTAAIAPGNYWWDVFAYVDGEFREIISGKMTVRFNIVPVANPMILDGFGDSYWEIGAFPYPGGPTLEWSARAVGFRPQGTGVVDTTVWDASVDSQDVIPGGRPMVKEDMMVPEDMGAEDSGRR